uniref:Uncharacterized protein n=1 Tax=Timema douglasi TaxID=61478 RepID=A0A7R8VZH6_TIMDO|nr:unnamed protein product [Timema douglasi]
MQVTVVHLRNPDKKDSKTLKVTVPNSHFSAFSAEQQDVMTIPNSHFLVFSTEQQDVMTIPNMLLDTRQWYHDTCIDAGEMSLTVSSEYG